MSDNNNITNDNKNSTSTKSEEQTPQEFVLLSDDVKASLLHQEQKNDLSSSPLSQKQNIPEKPQESNKSAEIKSKDGQIKEPLTELMMTNVLYFIGINSLALNILSESSIFTSTIVKILVILLINLLAQLALYQRQRIRTFLTKMIKKTSSGFKKTKELVSKKKGRLFFIGGVLGCVGLVITFQQNCEQQNMLRNLELELNELKIKTQQTNQMLQELNSQTILNTEESAKRINNLTKQMKQLESVVSNQQQQIQSISTTKREDCKQSQASQDKRSSQRSGIKEDRAGNIYMVQTEKIPQQPTKQEQEKQQQQKPQQQKKSQQQNQQYQSHYIPRSYHY